MGKLLLDFKIRGIDAIVRFPLSVGGLRNRGFNQSLLLAKTVSDDKGIPLIMNGLLKKTETPPQVGLPAKDRAKNLKRELS